ncbi:MAG: Rieske 2Fe-2S domain-containing protein [Gammaproteobacteria bacterium]|jgi:nitrite reductase/ring-hydroxylating ferredoxin subunit|nr:Rieske 2Fe-2S domain-containing protein [Gammaproteobacteria bacterium]
MSEIGTLADFPHNGSYSTTVEGRSLLVVRQGETFFVYENSCPHTRETLDPMGGSVLSDDGLLLHCQRHAAQFHPQTGECIGGPCLGEFLTALPVVVSRDVLYLD